jgi:DNA-binding NarL/FixJ family response regulator
VIRVLVADDHPLVRDGLTRLLEAYEDVEFVDAAADGREAVAAAELVGGLRAAANCRGPLAPRAAAQLRTRPTL